MKIPDWMQAVLCGVAAGAALTISMARGQELDSPPKFQFWTDQSGTVSNSRLVLSKVTGPTSLVINSPKGPLVTIKIEDGSMTFGENYKPDEAARVFWDAVSRERQARICPEPAR